MNKKRLNRLFFAELVMLAVSFVALWILNNHFLNSTQSNQIALLIISGLNIIVLVYLSYLSFKQKLLLLGSLILVFICFVAFGTIYLFEIFNVGNAIGHALQNSNFNF
jgi:hypothetical protein